MAAPSTRSRSAKDAATASALMAAADLLLAAAEVSDREASSGSLRPPTPPEQRAPASAARRPPTVPRLDLTDIPAAPDGVSGRPLPVAAPALAAPGASGTVDAPRLVDRRFVMVDDAYTEAVNALRSDAHLEPREAFYELCPRAGGVRYISTPTLFHGSFGEVALAMTDGGLLVAIKCVRHDGSQVRPGSARTHTTEWAELVAEALPLDIVDSPWRFQDVLHDPVQQRTYLVMQVGMGDLHAFVHEPQPAMARQAWVDASQRLAELAAHDIVHFDIKPANLQMDETFAVQISDFGKARRLSPRSGTARGVGTWCFMPPEIVLQPARRGDTRVDVWSLAISVLALSTGCSLFPANDRASLQQQQRAFYAYWLRCARNARGIVLDLARPRTRTELRFYRILHAHRLGDSHGWGYLVGSMLAPLPEKRATMEAAAAFARRLPDARIMAMTARAVASEAFEASPLQRVWDALALVCESVMGEASPEGADFDEAADAAR